MKSVSVGRIRFIGALIFLAAVLLLGKLYLVQIVDGEFFAEKADRQYFRRGGQVFNRGNIYFSKKDGTLLGAATLKDGFALAVNPRLIENPVSAYETLRSVYSEVKEEDFLAKAGKIDDPYEELAHRLPEEVGLAINEKKIAGVIVEKERWRYYPGENLAAHALGFVAYKKDELTGRYGLERYYNDVLSRSEGSAYTNFFAQIFSSVKDAVREREIKGEGDLVLTIEPEVEQELSDTLKKVKAEYNADEAGGIIMDPGSGAIYALSSLPDFNPNQFGEQKNVSVFGNPLIESVREMGSIIKPLTMAAGLDAGVVTGETTYNDKGQLTLDGKTIMNFDGKARGVVPMQEVLSQSLNTGAAYVESQLGNARFTEYFKNYGLGEETGIDLPGEVAGLIKNLDSPRDIEHATASFGQGIAMTPIATTRALASLANGGVLVTPHVVKEIHYSVGLRSPASTEAGRQVLKKETSEEITRMLIKVVDKALLGGKIKMERYSIAAKTGTAQVSKGSGGGYYDDRYLHSFFGYFPAYKPQFIIFLYLYYPKEVRFASETLTVPFSNLAKFLINYYQIPPDR